MFTGQPFTQGLFLQFKQFLHDTHPAQSIQFSQSIQLTQLAQLTQLTQLILSCDAVFIFFGLFLIVLTNRSSLPPNSSTNSLAVEFVFVKCSILIFLCFVLNMIFFMTMIFVNHAFMVIIVKQLNDVA